VKDDRQRVGFDLGFAPDADPLAPGVVTSCKNFVPTERGMRILPSPLFASNSQSSAPAFTTQPVKAYFARPAQGLVNTQLLEYAGAGRQLYLRAALSDTWEDISRGGAPYALTPAFWSFTSFGPAVIGAAGSFGPGPVTGMPLQNLPTAALSGDAADIAGSPTCCIVTSAERFVLAFNGRGGDNDTWNCSARDDHTSWTPSPATLAAQGRLVEPYGPITAAAPMGNDVIVYKDNGAIRGRFTPGDVEVWKWTKLAPSVGAVSPSAVCQLPDGRHAFMSRESCWLFDGAQTVDVLAGRARRWFGRTVNMIAGGLPQMAVVYDSSAGNVWFSFLAAGEQMQYAFVLNIATGKLGLVLLPADIIVETVDLAPANSRVPGYFEMTSHRLMVFATARGYTGITPLTSGASPSIAIPIELVSGDVGDPFDLIDVSGLKLDAMDASGGALAANVTLYSRDTRSSDQYTQRIGTPYVATAISGGERFAVRSSAHWHRVAIEPASVVELSGVWLRASRQKSERGG
jgi:hypothetical protein